MSIHSIAKELGVSEYALRTYAEEHKIPRKNNSRRSGYEFSDADLKAIQDSYGIKKQPTELYLMFRIYDTQYRRHQYLPAGILSVEDENLLKEFVSLQYTTSNLQGKKCYNFFICTKQQFKTRLNKLKKFLGDRIYNLTLEQVIPNFITSQNLPQYVSNKVKISYAKFVPQITQAFLNDYSTSYNPTLVSYEDLTDKDFYENTIEDDSLDNLLD